jgi:ribonuclease R
MQLITGRVVGHPEGHGFLISEDGIDNLFLSHRQMRELLHGDRVLVRVISIDARGRRECTIVDILERNTKTVVGRLCKVQNTWFVIPDDKHVNQDIIIPDTERRAAAAGQIVVAEIIKQPSAKNRPIGRIKEILGEYMAPGIEVLIAIARYGIPVEWPDAVMEEADIYGKFVQESSIRGRLDLRSVPLITIDSITARDLDDAVYCERRGNNWRLLVAIADVSWYVRIATALDLEARKRGNSVYFPDRVIPMLPAALSNGLCSLYPGVDRLCIVCEMTINTYGSIIRSRFAEAVMRSHAQLNYETAAAITVSRIPRVRNEYAAIAPHLDRLYALYQVLKACRKQRGAIDFDTQQETIIEYSADRKIEQILPVERNDTHRLIEECMIAANTAAARFLKRHKMLGLYRVHEGPTADSVKKLREFLGGLGLWLHGGRKPMSLDYTELLDGVMNRPDAHLIQTIMLRSLAKAIYSPDNIGHFGLALEAYSHFTSPIRRYPDLQIHRAIRHVLKGGKSTNFPYDHADLVILGEHCSMSERRAEEAVRDAVEWLKCEFMLDKIGKIFDGVITSVIGFGLFVELKEVYVEGLVHVTALRNDHYRFDPVGYRLCGEHSGHIYRIGDKLRVRVIRVNLDERKIDFDLGDDRNDLRHSSHRRNRQNRSSYKKR